MSEFLSRGAFRLGAPVRIESHAAVVGDKEGRGPLGKCFDEIISDSHFGRSTWEQAESRFQLEAVSLAVKKAGLVKEDIDSICSGDLINNPPGQGAAFRGFYVQGYAHAGVFGICFDKNRGWVGEGGGAGVGAGYVLPLTKRGHWRLEFAAQVGYFRCSYDPYQYENLINTDYHDDRYYYKWDGPASAFKRRQYRWNWFGPTRVGVTLSYDILYRRNHEPGISFKSTERRRKWKLKD